MSRIIVCAVIEQLEPLEWIRILTVGAWKGHPYGEFEVRPEDIASVVETWRAGGRDVVIDYHHQSLFTQYTEVKAKAAGWIRELEARADGAELWARCDWTQTADNEIRGGEYRYVSPVLEFDAPDKVSGRAVPCRLHSLALTNTPFFDQLGAVAAEEPMKMFNAMAIGLLVCQSLSLDPASEEARPKVEAYLAERPGLVPAAEVDRLQALLNAERATAKAAEQDALLTAAREGGQIVPAQEEWLRELATRDPAAARAWLAKAPRVVPSQHTPPPAKAGTALSAEELSFAARMGLSEAEYLRGKEVA